MVAGNNITGVERNIYGSSRTCRPNPSGERRRWVGMDRTCGRDLSAVGMMIASNVSSTDFEHKLGMKQYECTNHLGNVLSVVTDRKHPIDDDGNGFIDYYQPEITKATDYSPGFFLGSVVIALKDWSGLLTAGM